MEARPFIVSPVSSHAVGVGDPEERRRSRKPEPAEFLPLQL